MVPPAAIFPTSPPVASNRRINLGTLRPIIKCLAARSPGNQGSLQRDLRHIGYLRLQDQQQGVQCAASTKPTSLSGRKGDSEARFSEKASQQLSRAIFALRRYGWLGFWAQLSLSLTSAVVLLFSVAYTAEAGPKISMYMTLFSTIASLVSTFKNFGLVRMSRKLQSYMEAPPGVTVKKITKEQVMNSLSQIMVIAIIGLGAAVIGLQASVGILLAKTLTNTTANPFLSGGAGAWNPVLAFDVFLLQASTNTILSHFIGVFFALWMITRIRNRSIWQVVFG